MGGRRPHSAGDSAPPRGGQRLVVSQRPGPVKPLALIAALERAGWVVHRVKGSHHVLTHPDQAGRPVVPVHRRELAPGTLGNILRQAGLTREELERLL